MKMDREPLPEVMLRTAASGHYNEPRFDGGLAVNPWLAVMITGVAAFGLHILFVLAFRNKH